MLTARCDQIHFGVPYRTCAFALELGVRVSCIHILGDDMRVRVACPFFPILAFRWLVYMYAMDGFLRHVRLHPL